MTSVSPRRSSPSDCNHDPLRHGCRSGARQPYGGPACFDRRRAERGPRRQSARRRRGPPRRSASGLAAEGAETIHDPIVIRMRWVAGKCVNVGTWWAWQKLSVAGNVHGATAPTHTEAKTTREATASRSNTAVWHTESSVQSSTPVRWVIQTDRARRPHHRPLSGEVLTPADTGRFGGFGRAGCRGVA